MKLMNIFESLLVETNASLIEKYFNECISRHFPEYRKYVGSDWPIPKFRLRSGTKNAGVFSFIPTGKTPLNQTLTINTDFAGEKFLRSIVFHETIHYVQANLSGMKLPPYDANRYKVDHDAYFMDMMRKINSVEGENYITIKQDAGQLDVASKPFFVYGFVTHKNQYAYAWSTIPVQEMSKWLKNVAIEKYKSIFEFETSDYYFKTGKQKFTKSSFSFNSPDVKFGVVDKPEKEQYINQFIKS